LQPLSEDEGVFLTIANQINKGFLPYVDYFDPKPPGIYYFFALVTGVVGNSLLFARLTIALINLATAYLLFKIGSKFLAKLQIFWLILIFGILCILYQGFYALTEPLMVFFFSI
jgi:4-amino-4-deoxy-L-arabinose transferase-like glycosyltransferase